MNVSYRNRSRVSIRITKISARAGGVVDPVKFFLTFSLITVQNLVVSAHEISKILELLEPRALRVRACRATDP